jgi:lipopolysaccharide export system protein LptC
VNVNQSPAYQAGMDVRFAIAARHSRLVRILRVAVPAAVILSMATIVFISIVNPFRILATALPVDMGNLVVSGSKITMETPHWAGFSPDQRPYEMWAKTATQDRNDPDHVELGTLRAKVLMEDQSTVTMDARTGLYDTKSQMLDLRKDVFLQSSTGYEARLTSALVDIANGTVTSGDPVDVKLLNGTLRSDRIRVTEKGDVVFFEGNVVMDLVMDHPPAADAPAEPVAEAAPAANPRVQTTKPHSSPANRASAKRTHDDSHASQLD